MYKAIIMALAIALLTIGNAIAQTPSQVCDPADRVRANDLTTPCKTIKILEPIESIRYEFNPVLREDWNDPATSYCEAYVIFKFPDTQQWPARIRSIEMRGTGVTGLAGVNTADATSTFSRHGHELDTRNNEFRVIALKKALRGETGNFIEPSSGRWHNWRWEYNGKGTPSNTMQLVYVLSYLGKDYAVQLETHTFTYHPMPDATKFIDDLDHCVSKLAHEYEFAKERAALELAERESAQAEEIKELASRNAIKIAEEIKKVEARVDALRLKTAKQVDVNIIEFNLIRERTVKAGIEIDREITRIEIETQRKYMQSLEDMATWIQEWVLEKSDSWDELGSLQSEWYGRISELQASTAQTLVDLDAKRESISAAIAASEARQREIEVQIREAQADEEALARQLAAAQAELKAAQDRLSALQEGDEATPTPTPTP